jgi:putative ABC transport system permease protein
MAMAGVREDIKFGFRTLLKSPAFSAAAIVVLALGIGANTAIFSVIYAVLIKPLPFEEPSRLVQIWHVPPPKQFPGITQFSVSPGNYLDWEAQSHAFDGMAVFRPSRVNLTGVGRPEAITITRVSANFFSVLRAQAKVGRTIAADEAQPGRNAVAVLSEPFWRTHFAADPAILGKTIQLDAEPHTVIGVMPVKFRYPAISDPAFQIKAWVPLGWTDEDRAVRGNHNYWVVGRLKPGVDVKQAQAELTTISARLEKLYPADDAGWGAIAIPLREELTGEVRPILLVLLGAVAFVLFIACSNVANLLLAKNLARQKEIAIRTALGATRARVLQQILTETVLLAVAGGLLGVIVAHFGVTLIVSFLAQRLPRATEIGVDGWVLAFTIVISIASGLLAGLIPALSLSKTDPHEGLKQGGRTDSDGGSHRARKVLIVSEVALSLILLVGAGLTIRSLWKLRALDPGFDSSNVLTVSLALPETKYMKPDQQLSFFNQAIEKVRHLPGVISVGGNDTLPVSGGGSVQPVAIEGRAEALMAHQPEVNVRVITPGYFETMRIPIKQGRAFSDLDISAKRRVIVISESMANRFWPNENPIGKRLALTFRSKDEMREIVGVVNDVKEYDLETSDSNATLYAPIGQDENPGLTLAIRTSVEPKSLVSAVEGAVHEIDSELPLMDVITMDELLAESTSHRRFGMLLLTVFAGLALLLASIGIYSVLSYTVRRRFKEIGIRMALGAQVNDIVRIVLLEGMRPMFVGIGIGLVGALLLGSVLSKIVFGISPADPATIASVSLILASVAICACMIPAYRAARIDPGTCLRDE